MMQSMCPPGPPGPPGLDGDDGCGFKYLTHLFQNVNYFLFIFVFSELYFFYIGKFHVSLNPYSNKGRLVPGEPGYRGPDGVDASPAFDIASGCIQCPAGRGF